MKHLALVVLSCLVVCSCSDVNMLNADRYPQKWELVRMTGSMTESETTGEDMAWQEHYVLYTDHTFIKSSTRNGETMEAEGTYTIENTPDQKRIILTYAAENDIIGNCTAEPEEHLYFNSPDTLLSNWWSCDGPGLEYKRVE